MEYNCYVQWFDWLMKEKRPQLDLIGKTSNHQSHPNYPAYVKSIWPEHCLESYLKKKKKKCPLQVFASFFFKHWDPATFSDYYCLLWLHSAFSLSFFYSCAYCCFSFQIFCRYWAIVTPWLVVTFSYPVFRPFLSCSISSHISNGLPQTAPITCSGRREHCLIGRIKDVQISIFQVLYYSLLLFSSWCAFFVWQIWCVSCDSFQSLWSVLVPGFRTRL